MRRQSSCTIAALICALLVNLAAAEVVTMKPGEWISVSSAAEVSGRKQIEEGKVLGHCHGGSWAAFGPLDLSDGLVNRLEIKAAAPRPTGRISLHLGEPTGSKVAELRIQATGGYHTYAVHVGHAEQLSGTHRLILRFHGDRHLCNVKAFRFLKPEQAGTPDALVFDEAAERRDLTRDIEAILARNRADIEANRSTVISVRAAPGAQVRIQQTRHHFEFGTAIARNGIVANRRISEADRERYQQTVIENFNSVVHENAMKWYANERQLDRQTFAAADAMLAWSEANGLFTRGHCVYWGRDEYVMPWLKALDDEALRAKVKGRAGLYMARYRGRVPEHDVNNEMLHCTYFKKRLGADIWPQMFAWCREADPEATLYVNDYSILSGGDTKAYVAQIKRFIAAGMPVGGIGVQGHFGSRVNDKQIKAKLDLLAQFGLPIKVTEFDADTRDPRAKARALVALYASAFAHPSVKGIYMWGFWERVHWRPNAALWAADWTPSLAADYYRELVFKRWWTDATATADAQGRCELRVFYGEHEVQAGDIRRTITVTPETEREFKLQ
jgi:GH35 family endo-1,4-beta-xylanase